MTARLGRIHLRVIDLDRACRFYTRVLGLRVSSREQGLAYLASEDAHHEIALLAHASDGPAPPISLGCRFVGFEVPTKSALAAVCERLGGARAHIVDYGDSWSVHTTDPDGNGVEIYCHSPAGRGGGFPSALGRTSSLADLRAAARGEALGV